MSGTFDGVVEYSCLGNYIEILINYVFITESHCLILFLLITPFKLNCF